jgi:hypothetical protein
MTDDSYAAGVAEIRALRERLARLEALATAPPEDRSNPVIVHTTDFSSREERRQRDHASTYRPDAVLERLHGLAAKAEAGNGVAAAELAAMPPPTRLALGYFSAARDAAVTLKLADATTGELR